MVGTDSIHKRQNGKRRLASLSSIKLIAFQIHKQYERLLIFVSWWRLLLMLFLFLDLAENVANGKKGFGSGPFGSGSALEFPLLEIFFLCSVTFGMVICFCFNFSETFLLILVCTVQFGLLWFLNQKCCFFLFIILLGAWIRRVLFNEVGFCVSLGKVVG